VASPGELIDEMTGAREPLRPPNPKTARRMTSSVIRCVWGRMANGRPTGQVWRSRSVISRITVP
jgi:hypothetical protein